MASLRTQVRIFKPCILCRILTAPVGRVWRLTHFYSVALLLEKRFACHHSAPYFFISLFPTAFYDRSRMTGRYLMPFCKKPFFVSAHTCPFRRLRRHFSQGKASHTLLQRRFAPRKVVRLLPDKRGRLVGFHSSFISHHAEMTFLYESFRYFLFLLI